MSFLERIILAIYLRVRYRLELFRKRHEAAYLRFRYGNAVKFHGDVELGLDFRITMLAFASSLEIGDECIFRNDNTITLSDGRLTIGERNFFNNGCSINCLGVITIGHSNLFGENVKLYDHNHRFSELATRIGDQGFKIGSITIGSNCWIGSNTVILNNVTIGDNVVVGANNLIHESIPSNTVVKANSTSTIVPRR
jgi:acetyltransferase-like isoleucine patch superfamily enzyme